MNLIVLLADGWHFIDETGNYDGPYTTEAAARYALAAYCQWLNGDDVEDTPKNHLRFTVGAVFV